MKQLEEIGRFQWCTMLLYAIAGATTVLTNVAILFVAPNLDHYCDDDSPAFRNLTTDQQRALMTAESTCTRPDVDFHQYTSEQLLQLNVSHINGSRKCDTGFVYDRTHFDYTATEQVCKRFFLSYYILCSWSVLVAVTMILLMSTVIRWPGSTTIRPIII